MTGTIERRAVTIPLEGVALAADVVLSDSQRFVLFAHGSGSSRLSSRNRFVAKTLQDRAMGTLLFDLLTDSEARDRRRVFDIDLLADRLLGATRWIQERFPVSSIGYFGASTGAAATFVAASRGAHRIDAIVSRGGRPDLARDVLPDVIVPTLLIVGGLDLTVLGWNEQARSALAGPTELAVVPRATHLFEEAGALERVAELAADWFHRYLTVSEPSSRTAARP